MDSLEKICEKKWLKALFISLFSLLLAFCVYLAVFVYRNSYIRFLDSIFKLWESVKYYFAVLVQSGSLSPPPITLDIVPEGCFLSWLPGNIEEFRTYIDAYFDLLFDRENFLIYFYVTLIRITDFLRIVVILLPLFLMLWLLIVNSYLKPNSERGDTKQLAAYKRLVKALKIPLQCVLQIVKYFIFRYRVFLILAVIVTFFNLNLVSILISAVSFYLYFAVSFDFLSLFTQLKNLLYDLDAIYRLNIGFVFMVLAVLLFNAWRRSFAQNRLEHFEARNCGFIKELPICNLVVALMGGNKTAFITDASMSCEKMMRQDADGIVTDNDVKFPHFPWQLFEDELIRVIDSDLVYNLTTMRDFIALKRSRYEKHHNSSWQLYGYDTSLYPTEYNDGLKTLNIFDVMESYATAFFVYILNRSLILSNYSIRTDASFSSLGNYPKWDYSFDKPDSYEHSMFSSILDQDVLRLGLKVLENNIRAGSYEFGVIAISEVGKERGNAVENQEFKKNSDVANPRNDLWSLQFKMIRHHSTIDFKCFAKAFFDEQRIMSLGADARELAYVIDIVNSKAMCLSYPLFIYEEMLIDYLSSKFFAFYKKMRYLRGDNTLLVYLMKSVVAFLLKYKCKIYNLYGYKLLKLQTQAGTLDKQIKENKYYLKHNKIFNDRFWTDCFSAGFADMARSSPIGLKDYPQYQDTRATASELEEQHSYFIESLKNI